MGGQHDAPESWLERWQQQEPVRLYLWTVATAMLAAGAVAGWLTAELSLALAGVVGAVLMVGGAAAARSQAYAPATVAMLREDWERELAMELEAQHEQSWRDGYDAAAEEFAGDPEPALPETQPQPATTPQTALLEAQGPCPYVEHEDDADSGSRTWRCALPRHPASFPHQMEPVEVGE